MDGADPGKLVAEDQGALAHPEGNRSSPQPQAAPGQCPW